MGKREVQILVPWATLVKSNIGTCVVRLYSLLPPSALTGVITWAGSPIIFLLIRLYRYHQYTQYSDKTDTPDDRSGYLTSRLW